MNQPFSKVLETISTPGKISDILMKIKGAKVAAQIVKAKLPTKNQNNIVSVLNSNILYTTPAFYPYINIYKNSSYAQPSGVGAFANEIMKYL